VVKKVAISPRIKGPKWGRRAGGDSKDIQGREIDDLLYVLGLGELADFSGEISHNSDDFCVRPTYFHKTVGWKRGKTKEIGW
jgi:hypothetical protein